MPELMTKQDAIEYLLYMKHDVQAKSPMDIALDTAIEELKQPTIEPEMLLIPKEVSATDIDKLTEMIKGSLLQAYPNDAMFTAVRHGRWIECDYKHLEHGFMETEPKAGLCCSECRTAFQKKKMTYKQYCAACGAKMDGCDDGAESD